MAGLWLAIRAARAPVQVISGVGQAKCAKPGYLGCFGYHVRLMRGADLVLAQDGLKPVGLQHLNFCAAAETAINDPPRGSNLHQPLGPASAFGTRRGHADLSSPSMDI